MKIAELLAEGRLDVSIQDLGTRIFYTAELKESEKNWLQLASPKKVDAEATVDINGSSAYVNRIDAFSSGQKFGTELLQYILDDLTQRGISEVSTYIEHNNSASKSLFSNFGFTSVEQSKHGQKYARAL